MQLAVLQRQAELDGYSDENLVAIARQGGENAVRALIKRNNQRLFRVARGVVRHGAVRGTRGGRRAGPGRPAAADRPGGGVPVVRGAEGRRHVTGARPGRRGAREALRRHCGARRRRPRGRAGRAPARWPEAARATPAPRRLGDSRRARRRARSRGHGAQPRPAGRRSRTLLPGREASAAPGDLSQEPQLRRSSRTAFRCDRGQDERRAGQGG